MMDRCNVAVRQVDPHGSSGIGGKEIDDFAPDGYLARLVDTIVQEIAECDSLFAEVVRIDRIAYADAGRFRIEGLRWKIAARGGFPCRRRDRRACHRTKAAAGVARR